MHIYVLVFKRLKLTIWSKKIFTKGWILKDRIDRTEIRKNRIEKRAR